jgi:hypothetical protein
MVELSPGSFLRPSRFPYAVWVGGLGPGRRPDFATRLCSDRAPSAVNVIKTKKKESTMRAKRLTLQQRRDIFHALVTTQDVVMNVPRSRQIVTERFEITEAQLRQIEDEGLEKEWPPLSEAVQEQEVG